MPAILGHRDTVGRVLWIHHVLRVGLLQREVDWRPHFVVRPHHGAGQHSDVGLRPRAVVSVEG